MSLNELLEAARHLNKSKNNVPYSDNLSQGSSRNALRIQNTQRAIVRKNPTQTPNYNRPLLVPNSQGFSRNPIDSQRAIVPQQSPNVPVVGVPPTNQRIDDRVATPPETTGSVAVSERIANNLDPTIRNIVEMGVGAIFSSTLTNHQVTNVSTNVAAGVYVAGSLYQRFKHRISTKIVFITVVITWYMGFGAMMLVHGTETGRRMYFNRQMHNWFSFGDEVVRESNTLMDHLKLLTQFFNKVADARVGIDHDAYYNWHSQMFSAPHYYMSIIMAGVLALFIVLLTSANFSGNNDFKDFMNDIAANTISKVRSYLGIESSKNKTKKL